jgi:hypothetical protein
VARASRLRKVSRFPAGLFSLAESRCSDGDDGATPAGLELMMHALSHTHFKVVGLFYCAIAAIVQVHWACCWKSSSNDRSHALTVTLTHEIARSLY